jgi:peptidoglycan-N-acetylglucosamine deacetylase
MSGASFHPPSGFPWPDGKKFAASLSFDVDAEAGALAFDSTFHRRMSLMSHQGYGPSVAVPKLLAMLAHHDIQATFFVPGYTADLYPDMVRAIADGGHEVAHHGWMHEKTTALTDAQEAEMLDRGLASLERVGVRPVGYRAPCCCSPPDSSWGKRPAIPSRPTRSRVSGTSCLIWWRLLPRTRSTKATFW